MNQLSFTVAADIEFELIKKLSSFIQSKIVYLKIIKCFYANIYFLRFYFKNAALFKRVMDKLKCIFKIV